jgi:Alcohol dehydrogenase GroES-like domain
MNMKACRVHHFGPPEVISFEDVPRPMPGEGEVLVRVKAAGVGPWDAWIRAGKGVLPQPLPLTLGSDLSGVVEALGPGVTALKPGVNVFGVTNRQFTGAYAQYAVASVGMIAPRPARLSDIEAASIPVVPPLSGRDPERRSYASFATFSDPDGNAWLLQEVTVRLPGRVDADDTKFTSSTELASALRRAEAAHGEHEKRTGRRDADWPNWYAEYIVREQAGKPLPS